jgi:hypothetical protein
MSTEINIGGGGNQDKKNFYVDQNNNFYYNALYDQLADENGRFQGNIVEVTDWNTGKQLFGNALNGLDISVSSYRPPAVSNINVPGNILPSDLFILKQNAAPEDPEPLDIASMNTAYEKQQNALQRTNNAAQQIAQDKQARVQNANTTTPENIEADNTGRVVNTNAIRDPLADQLSLDTQNQFDRQFAYDSQEGLAAPTEAQFYGTNPQAYNQIVAARNADEGTIDRPVSNKEERLDFDDGWAPNINDGQFGSTKFSSGSLGGSNGSTKYSSGSPTGTANGQPSPVPAQYLKAIVPRDNPLDAFATYNYSISVYLVNKAGLQNLQQGKKTVAGLPLIMQSGGAPNQDMYGAYRSPYFPLDFYIDDVELDGVLSGTGTQHIHNQHTIRFSVTEPYGLTFIERLHSAVKHYKLKQGVPEDKIVYQSQMYLMVIRFYGNAIDGTQHDLASLTNSDARFTEKYIPFVFTGIRFRMQDDKIVYNCEAAAPMSYYNLNATHSAVPANMELTGITVGDVLKTGGTYNSLEQQLNKHAIKVAKGTEFANVYRIEFEPGADIENKKIIPTTSGTNKNRAAMKSSKENPSPASADRIDSLKRIKSIQAGTSIVQAIETIVRNSEFVTNQQVVVIDEKTGQPRLSDNTANQPFQWFKVVMQATPRSDKINPETGDHAYEIVYRIKRYQTTPKGDKFFPPPLYRGDHKSYKYWFTGQNTQVLNFTQDFNYLYFQQQALRLPGIEPPAEINTINVTRSYYMPRTLEDDTGTENGSGKIAAGVASTLYSPGDQAEANIEIVGDPDWIAQSEVFYGVDKSHNDPFEEDGSININASQVYFSIEYSAPGDYRDNGVLDPVRDEFDHTLPLMRLSYTGISVTSKFSAGQFTQSIRGALNTWTDSPYATRLANGDIKFDMAAYRANIAKRLTLAEAKTAERVNTQMFIDTADAALDNNLLVGSEQARMIAEQDLELREAFGDDLYNWDEDTAETDTINPRQTTVAGDDIVFNQGTLDAPTETQFWGMNPQGYSDAISTQNQETNPNTQTQSSITKTGGDKTVEQTPTFQEFPTPQPETTTDPADPYAQFANGIPYTRDVNDALLPEGYVYIARDASGELVQFRVLGNGDAEGIAAQDPETGEWYEL